MEATRQWLADMAVRSLWVAVAVGPRGGKRGLIECAPVEFAPDPVTGRDSLFINCIWVVPSAWRKGEARALLEYAIAKARALGGLSVLAYEGDKWWGYFPYMPVSFFERFGFREVDRDGSRVLLHLDLGGAHAPRLLEARERSSPVDKAAAVTGKTIVEVLYNRHCPWAGLMIDSIRRGAAKRAAARLNLEIREIETEDRSVAAEYGLTRGVLVNGRPALKRMGPWREIEAALEMDAALKMKAALKKSSTGPDEDGQ